MVLMHTGCSRAAIQCNISMESPWFHNYNTGITSVLPESAPLGGTWDLFVVN